MSEVRVKKIYDVINAIVHKRTREIIGSQMSWDQKQLCLDEVRIFKTSITRELWDSQEVKI
jgi:hypothetical protein